MKVSVERLFGDLNTVIRKPFDLGIAKGIIRRGMPFSVCMEDSPYSPPYMITMQGSNDAGWFFVDGRTGEHYDCGDPNSPLQYFYIALPALPSHPKPEDAALLYRYMAEGIEVIVRMQGFISQMSVSKTGGDLFRYMDGFTGWIEITHALLDGERVEIAIEEAQPC